LNLAAIVGHFAAQFLDPKAIGGSQTVEFASLVSSIAVAITGQDAALWTGGAKAAIPIYELGFPSLLEHR
jgi:hypothetical protein